jgi:hypothetical protein
MVGRPAQLRSRPVVTAVARTVMPPGDRRAMAWTVSPRGCVDPAAR